MNLAIWYHCCFTINGKRLPAADHVIGGQMDALKTSGLLDACSNFFIGINGDLGAATIDLPEKATVIHHGVNSFGELRTIRALEKWLPGHGEDWAVLYFHSKGVTRKIGDTHSDPWRNCMMHHLVQNWEKCVAKFQHGYDSVGCHWMEPPETPDGQYIWAGNFWWSTASYLLTLPPLMERARIKLSGIDSAESRFEGEVWHGNGEIRPIFKDFCPSWNPGRPHVQIGATVNP